MTLAAAVYLESGLLLALAALCTWAFVRWGGEAVAGTPARGARLAWTLVLIALAAPWLWRGIGAARPRAPIEVGPSAAWLDAETRPDGPRERHDEPFAPSPVVIPRALVTLALAALAIGGATAGLRLWRRRRALARLCATLPIWRQWGRVRLCACDDTGAPFAARLGGVAYIVVPTALCEDRPQLRLVIAHEAEHHRRGDLQRAALAGLLRAVFFWNPLLALWERALVELEDLACDRGVLRRPGAAPTDYARTLIWAVEATRGRSVAQTGARGMVSRAANTLRRRILMLGQESKRSGRMVTVALAAAAVTLVAGSSWAVRGAVGDQKLDAGQVAALAHRIEARSGFPLPVDDHVVEALNARLANAEGRARTQQALARMDRYRAGIETTLAAHHLPPQLVAVALAESGFDNEARSGRQSAGLWQFLPGTARTMGLEVSAQRDERLDPNRATEGAANLLAQLYQQFGDWPVAIAAYNGGPKLIAGQVQGQSNTEARALLLASNTEYGHYLANVLACVILTETPDLLK